MDIKNFKYNVELLKTKTRLEKELDMVQHEIENNQISCNHIRICLGWIGPFQCRDTSINECLLCGEYDPTSIYQTVDTTYYKKNIYGHGQSEKDREERMLEIRNLAVDIIKLNPSINEKALIKKLNQIIKQDIEKSKKLEKIYYGNNKY